MIKLSYIFFTLWMGIVILLTGCSDEKSKGDLSSDINSKYVTSTGGLMAVEIPKNNKFTPEGGITLSTAQETIAKYLEKSGVQGDIRSHIKVSEITVREAWENVGVQIYLVDINYACINGVSIVKDGKVLCVLEGMPTNSVFLSDLDSDGYYEVYSNASFGSGIVNSDINGYNIASNTKYGLSKRMTRDLLLFIQDQELMVKEYKYESSMPMMGELGAVSRLHIKDGRSLILTPGNDKLFLK
jgi:hypothetical protein